MTAITLFGLSLAPLYAAIAEVESQKGLTSPNVYQINEDGAGYVADVNRILLERYRRCAAGRGSVRLPHVFTVNEIRNVSNAEYMMAVYWSHWGEQYEKKTGRRVTYEVLARIHNGGPLGWKKRATTGYWLKVAAVMATQTPAEVQLWEQRRYQ